MRTLKETIEQFKGYPWWANVYYLCIALFWVFSFAFGPEKVFRWYASLWSPTNDPVLNFLLDTVLVLFGIAMGYGILVTGFYLLIAVVVLGLSIAFLLWLGTVSPTGTFLAIAIAIGVIYLIARKFSSSTSTSQRYQSSGSSSSYGSSTEFADESQTSGSPKTNPFLQAKKIEKAIFSDDRILRDDSGGKIGRLEKAIFSNDQIIKDKEGDKVGRIEQSVWDKDKQIIKSADGEKLGEIKTDIWGNRVITDSKGNKVGKIEKNIWGETVIKKK